MAAPPNVPIVVPKRVPFDDVIPLVGVDYSDATFLMHVRVRPGDTGTPLITLAAYDSTKGLSATYDDYAYTDPDTGEDVTSQATLFRIRIDEATLAALSTSADTTQDLTLAYDLHVAPSGGVEFILCAGDFIVSPGVTIPA